MNTLLPFRFACTLLLALSFASAHANLFYGEDGGVTEGQSRPSSDAAHASFLAAAGVIGPIGSETFESQLLGFSNAYNLGNGVTLTLDSVANDQGITNASGSAITGFNTTSGGDNYLSLFPMMTVALSKATFTFDTPVAAFGLYLTGVGFSSGNGFVSMNWNDGVDHSIVISGHSNGGSEYFGFTGPETVTSVSIYLDPHDDTIVDQLALDDIQYARTASVPEPASFIALAIGGLALLRRKPKI